MESKKKYLYESLNEDVLLNTHEEEIMKKMRELDLIWKKYKKKPGNRLILYCGTSGCSIRVNTPSADNEIASFYNITCDGGDGSDNF